MAADGSVKTTADTFPVDFLEVFFLGAEAESHSDTVVDSCHDDKSSDLWDGLFDSKDQDCEIVLEESRDLDPPTTVLSQFVSRTAPNPPGSVPCHPDVTQPTSHAVCPQARPGHRVDGHSGGPTLDGEHSLPSQPAMPLPVPLNTTLGHPAAADSAPAGRVTCYPSVQEIRYLESRGSTSSPVSSERSLSDSSPSLSRSSSSSPGSINKLGPGNNLGAMATLAASVAVRGEDREEVRQCQICNDAASGFHYGVWSCEGCKAFFKRSLQGPIEYICPATNNCTIDKHRRKSCQACRLRKCIENGMSRGKCRERKSLRCVPSPPKRSAEPSPKGENNPAKKPRGNAVSPTRSERQQLSSSGYGKVEHPVTSSTSTPPTVPQVTDPHIPSPHQVIVVQPTRAVSQPVHPLVEQLLKLEPPCRMASREQPQLSDTEGSLMSAVLRLCDAKLFDIIQWAKSMPGFKDMGLMDRIGLLESSWMEILLLGLMWQSVPHQGLLAWAPDFHMSREQCMTAKIWPVMSKVVSCVEKLRALGTNKEEIVIIKALLLLNAETEVTSSQLVTDLSRRLNEALHYTVVQRHSKDHQHLSQLLLLLPHIRQCSLVLLAYLCELKRKQILPLYKLIHEMLEVKALRSILPLTNPCLPSGDRGHNIGDASPRNTENAPVSTETSNQARFRSEQSQAVRHSNHTNGTRIQNGLNHGALNANATLEHLHFIPW